MPEHSLIDHNLVKKNEGTEWSDRTLRAISRGFKVSKEVILRRLLKFNLTTNKFYRKWKGGIWYKHQNTYQLPGLLGEFFWFRQEKINRYTKFILIENYN